MLNAEYVIDPLTGRRLVKGGRRYRKLIKQSHLKKPSSAKVVEELPIHNTVCIIEPLKGYSTQNTSWVHMKDPTNIRPSAKFLWSGGLVVHKIVKIVNTKLRRSTIISYQQ